MLRSWSARWAGSTRDLVEGAAEGKGGLLPSDYNMDMIAVTCSAAVFLSGCTCYYLVKEDCIEWIRCRRMQCFRAFT